MKGLALTVAWLAVAAVAAGNAPKAARRDGTGPADGRPTIVHIGAVAPDVLSVTVQAGRSEWGQPEPYRPQPGDVIENQGGQNPRMVKRGGKIIGGLAGLKGDVFQPFDGFVDQPLDTAWAGRPESYRLSSPDDPAYRAVATPKAIHRKSKPMDLARVGGWEFKAPVEHVLYLRLPQPLKAGKRYRLAFPGGPFPAQTFTFDPSKMRSEAVHVSHVGFRPDDPVKVAYLSCWMGDGGGLTYDGNVPFYVVSATSGKVAFTGRAVMKRAADEVEDVYKHNYNGADVYVLDFSPLKTPGRYRVSVEGIGCSYPFEVGTDAWRKAFIVSARGFYHQRSGIALGPPYTTYLRPRCFHPDDGLKVYQSTCSLMDSGNGLNALGTDNGNFGNLVKGRTDQVVPNAWGGYFDAGDWDRRIQHLDATRLQLELAELHPAFVKSINLNIPESGNDLPDLVDEALWNLDFYRRLQTPEGGIRGGIESAEHPQWGEGSWMESLPVLVYAPDPWCSYVYAGDAARAAGVLESLGKNDRAKVYRESALRAMAWAEKELPKRAGRKLPHLVNDARNRAAVELFRLTGDLLWHELFLDTTVFTDPKAGLAVWEHHDQADAAFVYARLKRSGVDDAVQANCRAAILRTAEECVAGTTRSGFGWTKDDPWRPVSWGLLSTPTPAVSLLRAYALTQKPEYMRAAVLSCLSGAGANPVNMCYTTGVGAVYPQNPLVVDQRISHQPPPPGITVYGPRYIENPQAGWEMKVLGPYCYPEPWKWPTTEAYFDVHLYPSICEFTVMQNLGPNAYVWGWLAARK